MNFSKWKCFFLSNAFAFYITLIKVNELKTHTYFAYFSKENTASCLIKFSARLQLANGKRKKMTTAAAVAAKAATSTSTVTEPMKKTNHKNTNKQMVMPKSNDDDDDDGEK